MTRNQVKTVVAYLENKCAFDQPMRFWNAGMIVGTQSVGEPNEKKHQLVMYFWKLKNRA